MFFKAHSFTDPLEIVEKSGKALEISPRGTVWIPKEHILKMIYEFIITGFEE